MRDWTIRKHNELSRPRAASLVRGILTTLLLAGACSGRDGTGAPNDATVDGGQSDKDADQTWDGGTNADASVPMETGCHDALDLADTSHPDHVVGDGSPDSCTAAALANAVSQGGVITFDCGPDPVTITVTQAMEIQTDTVVDGAGLVTLNGGGSSRLFEIPSSFDRGSPLLTVQRLAFQSGEAHASGDDTERGGGAIWSLGGSLHIIECSFFDNHAPARGQDIAGGAVYNVGRGETVVVRSVFSGNSASNGGALGVLHSNLVIQDSTFDSNAATGSGGNPGDGGCGGAIYSDGTSQDETMCGLVITHNQGGAIGGGVFRVSNDRQGAMVIQLSTIADNRVPDADTSQAGGMYIQGVDLTLVDSTLARNQAKGAGALFIGPGTTMNLTNVTIAENLASSSLAGGIFISSDSVTGRIRNCTFARNKAPGDVAFAAATVGGGDVVLQNTIFEGQEVGNGWNPITCRNQFQEGGGNIQWPVERSGGGSDDPDALCSPDTLVAEVHLGPLQDNGGPTETCMPEATSPAAGHGSDCPDRDQRGEQRSQRCTSGAVEITP